MTFAQAKVYLCNHIGEIRERIETGDPLCTTIAVLLELHLEDPDHSDTIGILTQAVQEYKEVLEFYPYYTAGKPTHLN